MNIKLFVISSPSGAGKSTLIKHIRNNFPQITFSISCTTRSPRTGEENGREYYFVSEETFKKHIKQDDFIEWEMVYSNYYGTLISEISNAEHSRNNIIIEVDVKGSQSILQKFPQAVSIFIDLPSIKEYKDRLTNRGTETAQTLKTRLAEIETERKYKKYFSNIIINDNLSNAKKKITEIFELELNNDKSPKSPQKFH